MTHAGPRSGGLLTLQRELAALLMEEPARRSFARSRAAHLKARGVRGREARLLASLDPDDVGYFASRRQIDRRGALSYDLPRTLALMEDRRLLLRYFRAFPYALEDPVKEAARVARWARGAARRGQVPALLADLAAFEAAHLAVRASPFVEPAASARPRRARGLRLLRLGHDLSTALRDEPEIPMAEPRPCNIVVFRGRAGVEAGEIPAEAFHVLRAADGQRTEAQVVAQASRLAGVSRRRAERTLADLRQEGLLAPRTRA